MPLAPSRKDPHMTAPEYRLEISDDVNALALSMTKAFDSMSLSQLQKLKTFLERDTKVTGRPSSDSMVRALAAIGLAYIGAIQRAQKAHAEASQLTTLTPAQRRFHASFSKGRCDSND
jgi:hypothetical protein